MQVQVTGKHVDVGDALRMRVSDDLTSSIGKYFERGGGADVVVAREGHAFKVDCAVTLASGQQLQSHGLGGDAHAAFSVALGKIEARIRRYKRRLKDHHEQATYANRQEDAAYTVFASAEPEAEEAPEALPVIAETRTDIPEVSVSDAVMMLDLRHTNALFFKNAGTGRHNMVYRRGDGSIGWVEPS